MILRTWYQFLLKDDKFLIPNHRDRHRQSDPPGHAPTDLADCKL